MNKKVYFSVAAVMVVGGGFLVARAMFTGTTPPHYVFAAVQKDTLITSITSSGQVQGESEIVVNAEVAGKLLKVLAHDGQQVAAGDILATLDSTTADKAVRDARLNLSTAQLSLQKLEQSADALTLLQAQDALAKSQRALSDLQNPTEQEILDAKDTVASAQSTYDQAQRKLTEVQNTSTQDLQNGLNDGYATVANAFTKLAALLDDVQSFMGNSTSDQAYISNYSLMTSPSYTDALLAGYAQAETSYATALAAYKASSNASDAATKTALISSTLAAAKDLADTLNDTQVILNLVQQTNYSNSSIYSQITAMIAKIPPDVSLINTNIAALQSAGDTIANTTLTSPHDLANAQDAVVSAKNALASAQAKLIQLQSPTLDDLTAAQEDVAEKKQQLANVQAGASAVDLATEKLTVEQRQNSLRDALDELSKYTLRAPIAGTVAKLVDRPGQSISSGAGIATVVAHQLSAALSLNEADVAHIAVGDKATLTFDAIDGLSITGEVAQIDAIGAVSSGVVNYGVLISFDTQDSRVLSGMSVSATIVTDVHQDVLVAPSSAVKSQGAAHYVEVLDGADTANMTAQGVTSTTAPRRVTVETGLSNDSEVEILSGLKEGDYIVTRTITAASTVKAMPATGSAASLLGGGGRGAGAFIAR